MSLYLSVFVYLALKLPSHYTEMVFLYREASKRLKDDLYSFWARVPPPPKEKSPLKKKQNENWRTLGAESQVVNIQLDVFPC